MEAEWRKPPGVEMEAEWRKPNTVDIDINHVLC
jgi:hypothetical protein